MNALARHTANQQPDWRKEPVVEEGVRGSVLTDREFVGELEKHKDAFYRFVRRTTFNQASVDDIFSSAVLAAYENRHKFTTGTNFRAWMYRILLNKCYVENRHSARTRQLFDGFEALAEQNGSWKDFDDLDDVLDECGDEVSQAFQHLSFTQRVCLLLRLVEQLSYREIAEVLEIPLGTVTTHLSRGRRRIRTELAEYAARHRLVAANRSGVGGAKIPVLAK